MTGKATDKIKKVVIAGAGVGGLTAAVALHRRGIDVEVYEKHEAAAKHTTGFTLWSYAIARLAALGVGPKEMEGIGSTVEVTEIRNQKGRLISEMPVGEVSRKLGHESYEIRRPRLLEALEACLPAGTVRRGAECVSAESTGDTATIELADGSRVSGDLVIGADGIHSKIRDSVAGPSELRDSGYRGCSAVAKFSNESLPPHRHIDIWGRGGKAGMSDVGEGNARWYLTWKAKVDAKRQTRAQLCESYAGWDPLVVQLIEATDESAIIHHEFFDMASIATWRQGRVVLLGDAAHATTPFAAMGANMTIEDIAVLMDLFDEKIGVEAALQSFEEARKKRTEDIVAKGRTMARLTQLHSPFAAWLRDQAFLHMPEEDTKRVTQEMASGD